MRLTFLMLLACSLVACSGDDLTRDECRQLFKKEVALIPANSTNKAAQLLALDAAAENCPSQRSRQEFDCIMSAKTVEDHVACKR